MSHFEAAEKGP